VAERERATAGGLAERARAREAELEAEIARVRASAATERAAALAAAERELAEARDELTALRSEIRTARRRERERRATAAAQSPAAPAAERERDRRLGAASERAARTEQALRALQPVAPAGPLAAGDPVVALDGGVHGTIEAIEGDVAEVIAQGGLRLRIAVARLRPAAQRVVETERPEPAVRILASARSDVSDELDVRGMRAQEAREAVRAFVDDAALAGLETVRVVHGRGTGALRTAVREELARHTLVERQETDSADGASLAHLG
jgi:DNA mismatch repair protein MutS2